MGTKELCASSTNRFCANFLTKAKLAGLMD
jgi:hypothetical protein